MTSIRPLAFPVFAPTVLFGIGQGAMAPIIVLSARELGASVGAASLLVALLGAGNLIGDVPAGALAGRIGERRALLGAAGLIIAALIVCVTATQVWLLALAVLALGIASAVWMIARHSYLTDAVPYRLRARAMSTLGGCMRIGAFIGPFIGAAAVSAWGTSGGYWVHLIAAVAAATLVAIFPEPGGQHTKSADATQDSTWTVLRRHLPIFRTLGIGILAIGAVRASRQVVIPLWAEHVGMDSVSTSIIFGIAGLVDMALFYPAGRIMDRHGRRWIAVPCMTIMSLALLLMPLSTQAWTLALVSMLLSAGNGMGSGIVMTLGSDAAPSRHRSAFLGGWRMCADTGTTGGPMLISAVTTAVALGPAILTMAAVGGIGAAVFARWLPRDSQASAATE